jgi:RNA polymerase sigma-70 factor (ECF subfamily)
MIYDRLAVESANPVFELNRAVALSYTEGPTAALDRLSVLKPVLSTYQPYHAALAALLARRGDRAASRAAYDTAIRLSSTDAERRFLRARMEALSEQ